MTESIQNFAEILNGNDHYEASISEVKKQMYGIYFTPWHIAERVCERAFRGRTDLDTITVADISCGSGVFLISAIEYLRKLTKRPLESIIYNQIFGYDISEENVQFTKAQIVAYCHKCGLSEVNESLINVSVNNAYISVPRTFDILLGNPPYITMSNLSGEDRKAVSENPACQHGKSDSYLAFMEISLFKFLKDDGRMAYVVPNTYLTSMNGYCFRNIISGHRYGLQIFDYGHNRLFKISSYSCVTYIDKSKRCDNFYYRRVDTDDRLVMGMCPGMPYDICAPDYKWLYHDPHTTNVMGKIKSMTPLSDLVNIHAAISTLANDVFAIPDYTERDDCYEIHQGDAVFRLEKDACRYAYKPSDMPNKHLIIYPYKSSKPIVSYSEDEMKNLFPETYRYLSTHRTRLEARDKGVLKYPWYCYGRTAGINTTGAKLMYTTIGKQPVFHLDNTDALVYNGYVMTGDYEVLSKVKQVMESQVFSYYISLVGKPYTGGYYSLGKSYIKDFSIPDLCGLDENTDILSAYGLCVDDLVRK